MTINNRMRAVRKKLAMTQTEFAEHLGISFAAVSVAERGLNGVSEQNIRSIVREFHVNEDWLRTGDGEMFVSVLPTDEVAAFMGDILKDDDDFRLRFISVLAKMTPEEWELLKAKVLEIADGLEEAAQK